MWYRYFVRDGWLIGESVDQYQNLPAEQAQVQDPILNRTSGLGQWVYTGAEIRDATPQEITDYETNRALDQQDRGIRELKLSLDSLGEQGRLVRALAVLILQAFNQTNGRLNNLLDAFDEANSNAVIAAARAINNLPANRTKQDLITEIKAHIDGQE